MCCVAVYCLPTSTSAATDQRPGDRTATRYEALGAEEIARRASRMLRGGVRTDSCVSYTHQQLYNTLEVAGPAAEPNRHCQRRARVRLSFLFGDAIIGQMGCSWSLCPELASTQECRPTTTRAATYFLETSSLFNVSLNKLTWLMLG